MAIKYPTRTSNYFLAVILLVGCGGDSTTHRVHEANKPEQPLAPSQPPIAEQTEVPKTEMRLEVQFRSGERVAERGFLVEPGGKVSFGPTGAAEPHTPGFWKSIDDGRYTVAFRDPKTGTALALIELRGNVRWDQHGRVVDGEDSFLRIMTEPDIWRNISRREFRDGFLVLVDETGKQDRIHSIGPGWEFVLVDG